MYSLKISLLIYAHKNSVSIISHIYPFFKFVLRNTFIMMAAILLLSGNILHGKGDDLV